MKGVEDMGRVHIGTYTNGESKGIYYGSFSEGKLNIEGTCYADNPSYLAKKGACLYAVSESIDGSALSFKIEKDGSLKKTGEKKVFGDTPCYVSVYEQYLFTANYTSGSISEFSLEEDGSINHPPKLIVHYGSGANKQRQSEPHVHQTLLTPDKKSLAVCDLGIDAVCFYPIDKKGIHEQPQRFITPSGMGPRHLAFGKDDGWYLVGELSNQILFCRGYGSKTRIIQQLDIVTVQKEENYASAIRVSPDGKCLLCTIRGEDSLILFDIDETGCLQHQQNYSAGGVWPRDAVFSPDGKYILVALQHSGEVCVFKKEEKLHLVNRVPVPGAACICF